MMWTKNTLFLNLLIFTLLAGALSQTATAIRASDLLQTVSEDDLSLVIFVNRDTQRQAYEELQFEDALKLLDRDLDILKVYETDVSDNKTLQDEFEVS